MCSARFMFLCLFVVLATAAAASIKRDEQEAEPSKIIELLRTKRSPLPEPHHRKKYHGSYGVAVQPVAIKPVRGDIGCEICEGIDFTRPGTYGGSGSFSQASSHSSSHSFGGFGGSNSQSSSNAQAGSSGYGK